MREKVPFSLSVHTTYIHADSRHEYGQVAQQNVAGPKRRGGHQAKGADLRRRPRPHAEKIRPKEHR